MKLYRYTLSCSHGKITPDKRELGVTVRCNSCAARGWTDRREIEQVDEIGTLDEEDTRG